MDAPDRRAALAEELLQEAVYRSRGAQAGAALLGGGKGEGNCGLGAKAAVVLDLTPRAEQAFDELFPGGLDAAILERVREVLAAWVRRQDGLDRRRNHFLKDFRSAHGADRRGYDDATLAEFEAGLERINGEALERRLEAARELLSAVA